MWSTVAGVVTNCVGMKCFLSINHDGNCEGTITMIGTFVRIIKSTQRSQFFIEHPYFIFSNGIVRCGFVIGVVVGVVFLRTITFRNYATKSAKKSSLLLWGDGAKVLEESVWA